MRRRLGWCLPWVVVALTASGCPRSAGGQASSAPSERPAQSLAARGALAAHALSRLVWPGGARLRGPAPAPGQRSHWQSWGNWAWAERFSLCFLGRGPEGEGWWRLGLSRAGLPELQLEAELQPGGLLLTRLREAQEGGTCTELPLPPGGLPVGPWAVNGQAGMALEDRGNESLTVPGGTFLARHWRLHGPEGARAEIWLAEGVSGGVVRSRWRTPTGEQGALEWVGEDRDPMGPWPGGAGQPAPVLSP